MIRFFIDFVNWYSECVLFRRISLINKGLPYSVSFNIHLLLKSPNNSNTFLHTLAGGSGVQGKGVFLPSGSKGYPGCDAGTFLRNITIWCMQEATWSFAHVDGPWQDEA